MAREDWAIFSGLAAALGAGGFAYANAGEVTEEMFKAVPGMKLGLMPLEGRPRPAGDIGSLRAGGPEPPAAGRGMAHRGKPVRELVEDYDRVMTGWGVAR
jgi:hypothetical protein